MEIQGIIQEIKRCIGEQGELMGVYGRHMEVQGIYEKTKRYLGVQENTRGNMAVLGV